MQPKPQKGLRVKENVELSINNYSFNAAEATEGFKSIEFPSSFKELGSRFNAAEATEGFKSNLMKHLLHLKHCFNAAEATEGFKRPCFLKCGQQPVQFQCSRSHRRV